MKKIFAILMSVVLMLSLAVPAMAANVDNETTHAYKAYQIFKGTQGTTAALGNLDWGDGINSSEFLSALKADKAFGEDAANAFYGCTTATQVAAVLVSNTSLANNFADIAANHVKGDGVSIAAEQKEVSLDAGYWLLVDQTTPTEGDAKNAALLQVTNEGDIQIQKKYDAPQIEKTVNDPDANIGDKVTFTLTATMPSNLEGYDTYKVIFKDSMSAGLKYAGNLKVTIDSVDKTDAFTVSPAAPTANETDGKTEFTVTCTDVLAQGAKVSSKIVVTYDAILDEDAVIGTDGNPNVVELIYSNDPNWDGEGDEPTGDTPEKEVEVYTWEIPVFKYTGTDTPLAGAGFTLYDEGKAVNLVDAGNGIYKVCTLTDCDHNGPEGEGNGHVTEVITGESGKFEIEGLEKGTYTLKETTTPPGYNTCADVTVVIGENGALTQNGSSVNEVRILNQSGATLPETGGMGTTIFYIVGGVMVVAAVVLLVTKKRMSAEG